MFQLQCLVSCALISGGTVKQKMTNNSYHRSTDHDTSPVGQHLQVFTQVDIRQHLHYHIYSPATSGFLKDTNAS